MSPTKLATLATLTGVATATKIVCVIFDCVTAENLIPSSVSGLMTLLTSISWLCLTAGWLAHHLTGHIDQQATEAVNRIEARIEAGVDEAGDRRGIAAAIAAMAEMKKNTAWGPHEQRRPHLVGD